MRIVMVNGAATSFGGAIDHAFKLVKRFRAAGWAVVFGTDLKVALPAVLNEARRLGCELADVSIQPPIEVGRLRPLYAAACYARKLRALKGDVAVAMLPCMDWGFEFLLGCRLLGLPVAVIFTLAERKM